MYFRLVTLSSSIINKGRVIDSLIKPPSSNPLLKNKTIKLTKINLLTTKNYNPGLIG